MKKVSFAFAKETFLWALLFFPGEDGAHDGDRDPDESRHDRKNALILLKHGSIILSQWL